MLFHIVMLLARWFLFRFKDIFQEVYENQGWEAKFKEAGIW
jgi:hypothetical protein